MSDFPHLIDNNRHKLSEVLNEIAPRYKDLSIATGYWDIEGTLAIIQEIKDYEYVRLLIGKEPIPHRLQTRFQLFEDDPQDIFPNQNIEYDLQRSSNNERLNALRDTVKTIVQMMKEGRLEVKVFRQPRLHAKAYIFGNQESDSGIGIIGSSNFTNAGLTSNVELNSLTHSANMVLYEPRTDTQPHSHLSWFNQMWNDSEALDWTGDFTEILRDSPLGDKTFGPYDVYIKTLMELFPDVMVNLPPLDHNVEKYLYEFQNQNALSLRQKLHTHGVAMLSDSVGLGKTVTAAAIIHQYIQEDRVNIVLILPASLKQQWIDELQSEPWGLVYKRDFYIITQQNINELEDLRDQSKNRKGTRNEIDLFVIDEAHNLRNQNSSRYQTTLEALIENPQSHVLLLTATPINNSLMDFANQIQLASKGDLTSVPVRFNPRNSKHSINIDFFESLKRIQSEATRADKQGKEYDWNYHKSTLISGLRHYLVRATRQGVVKRQALDSGNKTFPKSLVKQMTYKYENAQKETVSRFIEEAVHQRFEGINPECLNVDVMRSLTQINQHPLDIIKSFKQFQQEEAYQKIALHYNVNDSMAKTPILSNKPKQTNIIPSLFRLINLLGFTPYRIDTYHKNYYGKSIELIRGYPKNNLTTSVRMQMTVHNMLQTTWLKRLESSTATLQKSVDYYIKRIDLFERWLDKGYLVNLSDAATLESEYGDSIESAFDDYDQYIKELEDAIEKGETDSVKKRGVERKIADRQTYHLDQLRQDIKRDKKIAELLNIILSELSSCSQDMKLVEFANGLVDVIKEGKYGKKVLVFSFFSDTIKYLERELPILLKDKIPNFKERACFISGQSGDAIHAAQRFSPNSQKYSLKKGEKEIDFLFATDVLSEGQNLQDAGILANYDLHWNPVRMIQRNGRINRLGSQFSEILVANARPHDDLEEYLRLVRRLENKIEAISHSVGTDQSILGEKENPIEFTDEIKDAFDIYSTDEDIATEAWSKTENEDDLLDWVDDYSIELRNFLDKHKDQPEEVERIKSIPLGKWNYLPDKSDLYLLPKEIIGLYRINGTYTATNEVIEDFGFVKINASTQVRGPFASITAESISHEEALSRIRTTEDDNNRIFDLIEVNREQYMKEGLTVIQSTFGNSRNIYDNLTPARKRALIALSPHFKGVDLAGIISKTITRSNEKREFERLCRMVNSEISEQNQLNLTTVNRFKTLLDALEEKNKIEKELKKIEGVLFYANPEKY